jgi:hypothetical protein
MGGLLAGYLVGHYVIKPPASTLTKDGSQQNNTAQTLEVPKNATIISECAEGRGKQYVLPKDIPTGPVYNVWNSKVIGVEYMVGKDELLTQNKSYINLPLQGIAYDHINIGLLSQGHSGYPSAHYHIDLFTVPHSVASAIKCGAAAAPAPATNRTQ